MPSKILRVNLSRERAAHDLAFLPAAEVEVHIMNVVESNKKLESSKAWLYYRRYDSGFILRKNNFAMKGNRTFEMYFGVEREKTCMDVTFLQIFQWWLSREWGMTLGRVYEWIGALNLTIDNTYIDIGISTISNNKNWKVKDLQESLNLPRYITCRADAEWSEKRWETGWQTLHS